MRRVFNVSIDIEIGTDQEKDGRYVVEELLARACREHPEVLSYDLETMWVYDSEDPDDEGHEPEV